MLCRHAITAFEKYGTRVDPISNDTLARAFLINYDSLPGVLPHTVLPLFNVYPSDTWLKKMKEESQFYSKSRGVKFRLFSGDSHDKDSRATDSIQLYASKILQLSYNKLNLYSIDAIKSISPESYRLIQNESSHENVDWKAISTIPNSVIEPQFRTNNFIIYEENENADPLVIPHSQFKRAEFIPWAPFANHHSSHRAQV